MQQTYDENSRMPKSASNAIKEATTSVLQDGEKVIWCGVQRSKRFGHAYLLKALIPAFWTGGAIVIAISTNSDLHWNEISRWGRFQWVCTFVASIGPIGLLAAAFSFKTQPPTVYFVTNRRALAVSGKGSQHVTSYWPDQLGDISRKEYGDGSGDLQFAKIRKTDDRGEIEVHLHGFYGIENAKQVERLIVELRENAITHATR